jgi:hypothetical protein
VLREPDQVLVGERPAPANIGLRHVMASFGDTQRNAGD